MHSYVVLCCDISACCLWSPWQPQVTQTSGHTNRLRCCCRHCCL